MPSELLPPPALPSSPQPRGDLLRPVYVLERVDAAGQVEQRGILGSLDIRGTETGHVLRHMEVNESSVTALAQVVREGGGLTEPLLLAAPDLASCRARLADTVRSRHPDLRITTPENAQLRLWKCGTQWSRGASPIGPLLLADGHHRLEAARRLHRLRQPGAGPRLPALVVDHARHPLRLAANHRVIPGLDLRRALSVAERFARLRPRARNAAAAPPPRGSFLLAGEDRHWEVSSVSTALLTSRLRWLPSEWAELDAAVSDHVLIPLLCEEQGITPRLSYTAGPPSPAEVGVILPAPTWQQVWASAASGARMPVKTTSLAPPPPPGLLARLDRSLV